MSVSRETILENALDWLINYLELEIDTETGEVFFPESEIPIHYKKEKECKALYSYMKEKEEKKK